MPAPGRGKTATLQPDRLYRPRPPRARVQTRFAACMDSTPRTGGSLAFAETTSIFGIGYDSTVTQPHTSEARMPISSKYLFVVSMDVNPDKEALFNEVYDTEHIPNLLKVPGVRAVTRMAGEPFVVSLGGEEKKVAHEGARYSAMYEIDGPQVLTSPQWAKAVEDGRWPGQVRPFTHNRRHALYRVR